jgi:hypothetical protein
MSTRRLVPHYGTASNQKIQPDCVAERRAKLTVPIDKNDTYGFMRRQRKLDLLLRLPEKERQAVIANEKLDPELAQAILELDMPAEMLGLSAATCGLIRERALRAAHGDVIDELEELDTGIALADRAVHMARAELAVEASVAQKSIGPYSRRAWKVGVIRVVRWNVDKSGGTLAVPTEDELERGVFTPTSREYRAAHMHAAAEQRRIDVHITHSPPKHRGVWWSFS